jgi:hypothetical protein
MSQSNVSFLTLFDSLFRLRLPSRVSLQAYDHGDTGESSSSDPRWCLTHWKPPKMVTLSNAAGTSIYEIYEFCRGGRCRWPDGDVSPLSIGTRFLPFPLHLKPTLYVLVVGSPRFGATALRLLSQITPRLLFWPAWCYSHRFFWSANQPLEWARRFIFFIIDFEVL